MSKNAFVLVMDSAEYHCIRKAEIDASCNKNMLMLISATQIIIVVLLVVALTTDVFNSEKALGKNRSARQAEEFKPPAQRNVRPCDETCTNGGDVATCCRSHRLKDGVCNDSDRAMCW